MQVHALLRVRGAVAPWAVEPLHLPAAGAPVRHLRAELEGVTALQGHGHRQLRAARVQLRVLAFAGPPGAVVVEPSHRVVAGGADAAAGGGDEPELHDTLHQLVLQRGCRAGAARVEDEVAGGVPWAAFAGLPAAVALEVGHRAAGVAVNQPQHAPRAGRVHDLSRNHYRTSLSLITCSESFCTKHACI